jgi:hypothetical protein
MNRKEFLRTVGTAGAVGGALTVLGSGCHCAFAAADQVAPEKGTPAQKRVEFAQGWAKRFFDALDTEVDEKTRIKLMEANGRACFIFSLHGSKLEPMPIDTAIQKAQAYVGKENAWREGNTIYFNYVKNPDGLRIEDGYCLCPLVESGPPGLSGTYCACSVGYVGEMFKMALGRPVHVELLESLKRGGKRCRFKITLV